jgi:molybdopterin-guanine dinucleotide biosynthesis protein A
MAANLLVGIFVGGGARRMAGAAKGLLPAPDTGEPLVVRLMRIASEALPGASVVLVGDHPAYAHLSLPVISDDPPGIGPLGGLMALLSLALGAGSATSALGAGTAGSAPGAAKEERNAVIALSCDLPKVTAPLLAELASYAPEAAAVAPFADALYQPFFARYDPAQALAAARAAHASGERSLQSVFRRLAARVVVFPLSAAAREALIDWDEPTDVEQPR